MDFRWTDADEERFATSLALGRSFPGEPGTGLTRERWRRLGEAGLLGLSIPAEHGGGGLGALSTARAVEGFGCGCRDTGLVFAASAHLFACAMPVVEYGRPELAAEVLPKLADGRWIGANAITEEAAGSDVTSLATTAERDGDHYVLSGVKSWVSNGPVADAYLVYAVTRPGVGFLGVSAFLVPRDLDGVEPGGEIRKMGLDSCPAGPVTFDRCRVPERYRLGAEGQGAAIFQASMSWERSCLFAGYLGLMARQLETAVEHARDRRQFGKPIGRNQAVSHRLADMKLRLESARWLLYKACWSLDQKRDEATLDVCLAKVAVSEAAVRSGIDSMQILGGLGYTVGAGLEGELRSSLPGTLFSGTSEIQRELIARELGL